MIASLFVLAALPAAFGELPAFFKIAPYILEAAEDSSQSVCLLQRDQGQVRRGEQGAKAKGQNPREALVAVGDLSKGKLATEEKSNATEASVVAVDLSEGKFAVEEKSDATPPRNEESKAASEALPRKGLTLRQSSSSTDSSSSLAGSTVRDPRPLKAGVSEGMGIDYSALALEQVHVVRYTRGKGVAESAGQEDTEGPPEKNKIVLMFIEMFPLCWLFAVDRFYLGNIGLAIAKLTVSLGTCFIGGAIWGLVDFIVIMKNALRQEEMLNAAGMHVKFPKSQLHMGFVLAIVDILMIPALLGLARFVWWWRKQQRMERLKEAAMRSPHYGVEPHQVKGG